MYWYMIHDMICTCGVLISHSVRSSSRYTYHDSMMMAFRYCQVDSSRRSTRHARRRWQWQTNGATSGRKDVRSGCGAISDVRTRGRYCGLNRRRTLARQCSHAPLRCSVRRRPAARTTVLAAAARPRSGLPASAAKAARPPARSAGRQPCRPFNEWLNRWATHLHRRRLSVATALCIECDRVCVRACVRACR